MGSLRGAKPLRKFFPVSLEGEGDTGGEGDSSYQNLKGDGVTK